jgi:carboxyvinyl-carboxyphosphonate phosphorylmutase
MRASKARATMRDLLRGETCLTPASVFDPLSARIARGLGFETAMLAGSNASLAILGAPDITLITLTELADLARRITRASDLPVIVDADHGYGNALNVRRTVEELEAAGIAALTIEDTLLPASHGVKGTSLISLEEGVGKMRAALDARSDPGLVIVGRTAAAGITSAQDALERCRAYEAAGVDALFLSGVRNRADLETVCRGVSLPVLIGPVPEGTGTAADFAALGIRIALAAHLTMRAAMQAVHDTMKAQREGGAVPPLASPHMLNGLSRDDAYRQWMKDFLDV